VRGCLSIDVQGDTWLAISSAEDLFVLLFAIRASIVILRGVMPRALAAE
jgi:hypothetical protein